MTADFFDYPRMIRDALRQVPREALVQVSEEGMPAPHHFYLTFRTDLPGVELSRQLRTQYPEEMTIVLKIQFDELEVGPSDFSVTLYFGGRPERIRVPFAALTAFADPPAAFGLRFDDLLEPAGDEPEPVAAKAAGAPETAEEAAGRVVSFEDFRRRSSS